MTGPRNVDQSYATEVMRKGIHLASLLIPVIYYFIPRQTALLILGPLTLAFVLSDVARLWVPAAGRIYHSLFGFLLREHERVDRGRNLTGASYVLLSATLCVIVFPKVVFLTAFAILIVSDTAAALVGRRFGRHPLPGGTRKTFEGSAAFLLSALLVVAIAPKIDYLPAEFAIGAAGAFVGTLVEAASWGMVDDNLSLPVSVGALMWFLYSTLIPGVNVYRLDSLV